MEVIYANTWEELTVGMLGYYHDHCHHHYSGKTIDVPNDLRKSMDAEGKYCFIYTED